MDRILSPIKQRITFYLENQGVKKSDFYKKTGISPSNFKGTGAKSELGGDKIVKIVTIFEDISPEWLLTGKGEMLKIDNYTPSPKALLQSENLNFIIKYLVDNNKELMEKELFRKYIEGNIKFLELEKEKLKYDEEMQKLKDVIVKKLK
ncbi:hypothetical protein [Aquimarina mytili]|uniref:HTH cro/C1-type domain-containing protein n=1 Tax=Aquimarina mytili TaxID=874423 RepID=A0A937D6E8_9FLAO|nr:hypothetical protein [Aquimarina mytili]MBL0684324.1 hypothetical protein [Aquimarina mytili]